MSFNMFFSKKKKKKNNNNNNNNCPLICHIPLPKQLGYILFLSLFKKKSQFININDFLNLYLLKKKHIFFFTYLILFQLESNFGSQKKKKKKE